MSRRTLLLGAQGGPVPPPVPIPRGPLPAFDPDAVDFDSGAPLPVTKTLNLAQGPIPPFSDVSYHRANLWSVTLPGAPFIDGGATGPAQNRLLTYLWDRYPEDWKARWLKTYGERGYRQFWLSIPDSRDRTGLSLQQYCDNTKRIIDAGLIPNHFLRSKDYDGLNPDPTKVYPWVDALLKINGAFTEGSFAWEASLMYSPALYAATIKSDTTRYPQVRWGVHLQQGYWDFGLDGEGHGPQFWNETCIPVGVTRIYFQYVTQPPPPGPGGRQWSAGMMQARGTDGSVRLIQGGTWRLTRTVTWIPFEVRAQNQFNNELDGDGNVADEDHGDLKGYEMLCTPGPLAPRGFGNGARMPDGTVI